MSRRRVSAKTGLAGICALTMFAATGCLQDPSATEGGLGGQEFAQGGTSDDDGVVTILGAFGGDEESRFNDSLAAFEDESGIDIQYVADTDFTTTVKQRVNSGDSPDIGLFPQPGGLLELADEGNVQAVDTYLDFDELDRTLIPGMLESVRLNGRVYGAPMRLAVKSIVWYPKKAYEELGLPKEPKSLQELTQIADKIKATGASPWCMAWGSDQATGWVGTDWIEEYVLRLHGPDVYDDWVSHRIPFDDPKIVEAYDAYGELALTEGNVLGGTRSILSKDFGAAMTPAFPEPSNINDPKNLKPSCFLHRQGNFATTFYPPEVQADIDEWVGVFVFPPEEGGFAGQPILGGADMAALFNGNDAESQEVMQFLTSDQFGAEWAQAGGWLSPHTTFDAENYPDETTREIAEIAASADVFRIDASDLMPKEVGSGTFWTGMVEWVDGTKTSEEATADIESSWPE
jgi:alpha-glucoside transport system substrate-binding protein